MAYLGKSPQLGSYVKLDDISGSFDSTEVTFNLTSGGKPSILQTLILYF